LLHAVRPESGTTSKGKRRDGHADGVPEMMHITQFFGFALALVIPGALLILLIALLLSGER
jgi:hypothetical protein